MDFFRQDGSVLMMNAKLTTSLEILSKPKALSFNSLFKTLLIFIFVTFNSI
jgi:hypothetical protein